VTAPRGGDAGTPLAHWRANATLLPQDIIDRSRSRPLPLNRRELFMTGAAFTVAGAGALPWLTSPARADDIPAAELAHTGSEGDVMIGSDKAPVTIIEYASMTCPHCAHFATTTYPELKQRYIDTGKVRYTVREFPLDALAAAGFMLARCGGNDKYMPIVETLFAKQADWIVKEPLPALKSIAKQFGFTEDSFNECLANQKLLDSIQEVRDHAAEKLGVNSTPTFFINGKKLIGDLSIEQMAKEIDPYLKDG
jgi:protein-disulfide isomerase